MNNPIRILHVIGKMNRCGAETMIMNIYREINKSKVQFDFVVHTNIKGDYDDEIKSMGGRIYNMPRFDGANIYSYRKAWYDFLNIHKEYKIIHGHIGSSASIYLNIAKKYGLFTIAHSHNTKSTKKDLKGILYPLFTYPTRYIADYFFACSRQAGIDRYGEKIVNSQRFHVLKNAIFANDYIYSEKTRNELRSAMNINNKFVLGHIGRFSYQKNHDMLIDVFYKVHKKYENSILILIGDGELKKTIENKVYHLGLKNAVVFTGVRSDIPELLQAMDVFVFPSLYEGLGIVTIEAQAAGLPCILSNKIPKEAYVTNLIESLPLNAGLDKWADTILKYINKGISRKNTYDEIKNSGYDISDTVEMLEKFYLSKYDIKGGYYDFK